VGPKTHWERIFSERSDDTLSWYQAEPSRSLALIEAVSTDRSTAVIDVGGGTSLLVDRLLDAGYGNVAVLDISGSAIDRVRARLGERAGRVRWLIEDVTDVTEVGHFDVWHDRAIFHFVTEAEDRRRYVDLAARTVPAGGHVIIATFAPDGPSTCSGLDVRRYDADGLAAELGGRFLLEREERTVHVTPRGVHQPFTFAVFRRIADPG
jgi:2-polyprenyl-3-methyl-5-hydroxy-6-metoxy-1,4-benzoquinol methylase